MTLSYPKFLLNAETGRSLPPVFTSYSLRAHPRAWQTKGCMPSSSKKPPYRYEVRILRSYFVPQLYFKGHPSKLRPHRRKGKAGQTTHVLVKYWRWAGELCHPGVDVVVGITYHFPWLT